MAFSRVIGVGQSNISRVLHLFIINSGRRAVRARSRLCAGLIALPLAFLSGCASYPATAEPMHVTLALNDTATEHAVVKWLIDNGIRVDKNADGDDLIYDSPACRSVLVRYRRALRVELRVISENVANLNTTLDEHGANNPYRRRFLAISCDLNYTIEADMSAFRHRYEPGNRAADSNGMVNYPNVDQTIELADAKATSHLYAMVTHILERFDSTYIDPQDFDDLTLPVKKSDIK